MNRVLLVLALALSTASAAENATQAKPEAASTELYQVQDGNKVDAKTLMGWKTWRALACERCHGAQQEGLVGPPLAESLKTLSKEDFHAVMTNGRPEKGMPPFNTSAMVNENWEGLYAYLKGRSDGKIAPGRLSAIGQP
ncbi:MAG: c-type cytochrome [Steroidobacteraceae bacterium]